MKCEQCRELLWDYAAHTLSESQMEEVAAHLECCRACALEEQEIRKLENALHALPEVELPEGYHQELMARIAKETAQAEHSVIPLRKNGRGGWKNLGLIAAAVLVLAAAGGIQGIEQMRQTQQEMVAEVEMQASGGNQTVLEKDAAEPQDTALPKSQETALPKTQDTTEKLGAADSESAEMQYGDTQEMSSQLQEKSSIETEGIQQRSSVMEKQTEVPVQQQTVTENNEVQAQVPRTASAPQDTLTDMQPYSAVQTAEEDQIAAGAGTEEAGDFSLQSLAAVHAVLEVTDIPTALEEIRRITAEMGMTESSMEQDRITVSVSAEQTADFYKHLQEVGTLTTEELHAADAAYVEITVQLQQASEEEPQQSGNSQERDFQ